MTISLGKGDESRQNLNITCLGWQEHGRSPNQWEFILGTSALMESYHNSNHINEPTWGFKGCPQGGDCIHELTLPGCMQHHPQVFVRFMFPLGCYVSPSLSWYISLLIHTWPQGCCNCYPQVVSLSSSHDLDSM